MAEHVMRSQVRQAVQEVKGFLEEAEGERLFELARKVAQQAPCLEIGSYCGRSTLYLAEGCGWRAGIRCSVWITIAARRSSRRGSCILTRRWSTANRGR